MLQKSIYVAMLHICYIVAYMLQKKSELNRLNYLQLLTVISESDTFIAAQLFQFFISAQVSFAIVHPFMSVALMTKEEAVEAAVPGKA